MKKILFCLSLFALIVSCDGGVTSSNNINSSSVEHTSSSSSLSEDSSALLEFTNVKFEDKQVTYDGSSHSLTVENLIEGASVKYNNANSFVNVGEYKVEATISKEGYVDKKLTATLSIIPADFEGIKFENVSIEYDGNVHTIAITGNLPQGSLVTYHCVEDESITNKIQKPGKYTITATIENPNYNTITLTCVAEIVAKEEERFITSYGNKIYFQNALDKDRLYSYSPLSGASKINNNKAQYFVTFGEYLYYRSDSLFSPSIVRLDGISNNATQILSSNAEYLIEDGKNIYFAVNSLLGKDNGIYRLNIENDTVTTTQIFQGKAYYLQSYEDKIYFADGNNSKKLSFINKNATEITEATLLLDEKINNLTCNKGVLYFTINNLLGDYIAKYNLSTNKLTKLTSDAGSYLVVVENDLYYVNVDLINSTLIGKGIYKVSTLINDDSNLPGVKVISDTMEEYELSSLTYLDGKLYFYRVFDGKLYSCDIKTGIINDLLKDFTIPEEKVLLAQKGAVATYKDSIYYQNQYDNGNLYCYNTINKSNTRITSSSVDDIYIYKNYLYYRQVSFFVNKDLYRIDIENGGEPTLISTDDCGELEIYNDKIYYVNYSGSNSLHQMNLDGSEDTIIYEEEVYNLRVKNDKLYFIQNSGLYSHGYIYTIDLNNINGEVVKFEDCRTSYFEFLNDNIYFRRLYGLGYTSKCLSSVDLDGNNLKDIYKTDCDPTSFTILDDNIYYFNDVIGNYSISKFDLKSNTNSVLKKNAYAYNLISLNEKIYYFSYGNAGAVGDGHFYEMNLDGTSSRIDII